MYYRMSDEELAEEIRNMDTWDDDYLRELCSRAGMEDEYAEADGETFESVVYAAAKALDVEI